MGRLLFPQDRTAFVYVAPGKPILAPGADYSMTVYLDVDCTSLADVVDLDQVAIPGSVITMGEDSLLPEFYGPDGVTRLWVTALPGAQVYVLDAQVDDRLDALEQMIVNGDFTGPQGPAGEQGPPGEGGPGDEMELSNLDGGYPDSVYGGTPPIDLGGV